MFAIIPILTSKLTTGTKRRFYVNKFSLPKILTKEEGENWDHLVRLQQGGRWREWEGEMRLELVAPRQGVSPPSEVGGAVAWSRWRGTETGRGDAVRSLHATAPEPSLPRRAAMSRGFNFTSMGGTRQLCFTFFSSYVVFVGGFGERREEMGWEDKDMV